MVPRTADPSASPDFLSRSVASQSSCGFPYRKPHTLPSLVLRTGNPGSRLMTLGSLGFPIDIGCEDPRSQTRDLGHPICYLVIFPSTCCRQVDNARECRPSRRQSIVYPSPLLDPYSGNEIAAGYRWKRADIGLRYYQCGTTIVPFRNIAGYYPTKVVDNCRYMTLSCH
jgi:hypothetical protein